MSLSNAAETNFLKLLLQNVAWALIGDASGLQPSATPGNLYLSLHTSDPGESGDQTTGEIAYTGYTRMPIVRSSSGWTVSGDTGTNVDIIDFPKMTGGAGGTATYAAVGTALSGAGERLLSGALTGALASTPIIAGIIPRVEAGALTITAN